MKSMNSTIRQARCAMFCGQGGLTIAIISMLVATLQSSAIAAGAADFVRVSPAPQGLKPNVDYLVRVRCKQGEWKDVFLYPVLVLKEFRGNEQGHDDHIVSSASVGLFDFSGDVEVEVTPVYTVPKTFSIRPVSKDVKATLAQSVIHFHLTDPAKLVIAFNGDKARELHLFANPPETLIPSSTATNVKYFPSGIHTLDPFEYKLKSNEIVYLAPGAVVHGQFTCDHVQNATIRGRGIIDQSDRFTPGGRRSCNGINIVNSRDITVDGVTIFDSAGYHIQIGQSRNVNIHNTNSFSVSQWADGIDAMSCSNLTIDSVFVRSADDSIALYCGRWIFKGDSEDIAVTNSVLWADVAHPIFMGCHAVPEDHENLRRVKFRNIDILEHHQPGPGYQGCMAINAGDNISISDVSFDDIRVEPFTEGRLFSLKIFKNGAYNNQPGRAIRNVLFRNVSYHTSQDGHTANAGESISEIEGFDDSRLVDQVRFENLMINNQKISDAESAHVRVGSFVKEVTFAGSAQR